MTSLWKVGSSSVAAPGARLHLLPLCPCRADAVHDLHHQREKCGRLRRAQRVRGRHLLAKKREQRRKVRLGHGQPRLQRRHLPLRGAQERPQGVALRGRLRRATARPRQQLRRARLAALSAAAAAGAQKGAPRRRSELGAVWFRGAASGRAEARVGGLLRRVLVGVRGGAGGVRAADPQSWRDRGTRGAGGGASGRQGRHRARHSFTRGHRGACSNTCLLDRSSVQSHLVAPGGLQHRVNAWSTWP